MPYSDEALLELLGCPRCGGALAPRETALPGLSCEDCGAEYPVLGGVPILVADPSGYVAQHRDAILATLLEAGAHEGAADAVAAVTSRAPMVAQVPFDDDWTRAERDGAEAGLVTRFAEGAQSRDENVPRALDALDALEDASRAVSPVSRALALAGGDLGRAVELGCGAGVGSPRLAAAAELLIVTDASLRAVLKATARCSEGSAPVYGVVMDAENPALAEGAADSVIALNVVDVLNEPAALLEATQAALAPRGLLLLTTPDPALGLAGGPTTLLADLSVELGYSVTGREDGVPWLRVHGPREAQIFLTQVLALMNG